MHEYCLSEKFPNDVMLEINNLKSKIEKEEINKRKDIRKIQFRENLALINKIIERLKGERINICKMHR